MRNEIIAKKQIAYIDKILDYTNGYDALSFGNNTMLVEACVFNLSQIGELAISLDESFRDAHPEVPWNKIAGLRHRIVHDYEGVKILLIWDIIENELRELRAKLVGVV